MQHRFRHLAILCLSASFIGGCESGSSNAIAGSGQGGRLAERTTFSSPAEALLNAESLRLAGANVEALAILAEAHRRYPNYHAVTSAYGRLALVMGHDELAANLLQTALAANPQDWRAMSARGVLEWRKGRESEAYGTLIKARSVSAEDSAVLNNIAVSYLLEGRAAEAVSLLRQALASSSLNPAHAGRVKRNLALALAVEGQFAEADRFAGTPMPRTLRSADAGAIRDFMGISVAAPSPGGWTARIADVNQAWEPVQ